MKKPNIETLTKRLKRLNSRYAKLSEEADKYLSENPWNPSPERSKLRVDTDAVCSQIMSIECQIINALLAKLQ